MPVESSSWTAVWSMGSTRGVPRLLPAPRVDGPGQGLRGRLSWFRNKNDALLRIHGVYEAGGVVCARSNPWTRRCGGPRGASGSDAGTPDVGF